MTRNVWIFMVVFMFSVSMLLLGAFFSIHGASIQPPQFSAHYRMPSLQHGMNVWHDPERRVTCYILKDSFGPGLSCLPDRLLGEGESHANRGI
jgi:hypothetical protein